jgi:hypothetical protein
MPTHSTPKPQAPPQQQASPHPETQKHLKGAPGDKASKVQHRERDARTGHDKDGNEEKAPPRTGG